jgi:hemerythrin-like domain-containing protein
MDLFAKIKEEHVLLLGLVDDLVGADPVTHRRAMDDLTIRILAHMNAEEQSIYQAFEELDPVPRSVALRHEAEHHVAKMIMNDLQDRIVDTETWTAKLQVFQFLVKHHVESEERTMFDMAKDYFTDEEMTKIAEQFERVEADLYNLTRVGPLTKI